MCKEYIEREAAIEAIDNSLKRVFVHKVGKSIIDKIPAADVRPVVPCGECKYWGLSEIEPSFHVCKYLYGAEVVRNKDDFCSRGKKREES